jgi:hypothetical protein
MSYTLTVSQASSVLSCNIYPPLPLNDGNKYEVGLLSFCSYFSVPNVDEKNNRFHFGNGKVLILPVGSYELKDISTFLRQELGKHGVTLAVFANNNTLKILLKSSAQIDFTQPYSIGSLLGYDKKILKANEHHYADRIVDIMNVNTLDIQCNLSRGAYINGVPSHSLHSFPPRVAPGFKIVEVPQNIIYLPVDVSIVDNILLKICDQHGELVNFRGEEITIRLHIRKAL